MAQEGDQALSMQYYVHVTSPVEERVRLDAGNPVVIGRYAVIIYFYL